MSVAAILRGESLFSRVPLGILKDLPRAARTVYESIHHRVRLGKTIDISDRELANECGIVRRTVQKGLRQLEDLGIIERVRTKGRRLITWLIKFASATPKPKPAAGKPTTTSSSSPSSTTATRPNPAGSLPEQNRNLSGRQMAKKILEDLQVSGRRAELDDDNKIRLLQLPGCSDMSDDLIRLFRMYVEDVRALLMESRQ
jgi:DNA-binding transcriptional MocR family regulator